MRLLVTIVLLLGLAACAMPQSGGGGRVCIGDTATCYFPGDPNAPADPYARR
ncbi:MAG: hypothetical protein ACT4P3_13245 [Betaproteobacteria bacterium]